MFDPNDVWPEYLIDANVMLCPSDPDRGRKLSLPATEQIDDHAYIYLGYVVTDMDEARAFTEAYQKQLASGGDFTADLTVAPGTGNAGGDVIYRLSDRVETDVGVRQSEIPVMIERLGNHIPDGANVLYMDGHVEYFRDGTFPMTRDFMELIESLEY
jgi:prepilin-type processing-associated H-X9-DG protein